MIALRRIVCEECSKLLLSCFVSLRYLWYHIRLFDYLGLFLFRLLFLHCFELR
jgi:hypothetical protein